MSNPPLPTNIGKKRTMTVDGEKRHFTVLDEITQVHSTKPDIVIYLQRIQFEDDGRNELRLAYYIIGKKPRMAGKWAFGQYATMMPIEDFQTIIQRATEKGWI